MQVEDVGDGGVIWCVMLHFKPSALVWRSAENSEFSVAQFQERKSTDVDQIQGLFILANVGKPKLTIGALVIPDVFDGLILWIHVEFQFVVESLTRVFDIHTKVRDIIIFIILSTFSYKGSLDWTYDGYPSGRRPCLSAAHIE